MNPNISAVSTEERIENDLPSPHEVPATTLDLVGSEIESRLNQTKREIRDLAEDIKSVSHLVVEKVFLMGEKLEMAKSLLRHGEWCVWVDVNLPYDVRIAQYGGG